MGKNNRKRKLAHGAWEKVDVGLVQGSDVNHYDSDKTAPGAVHDLEADPSEAMGMFFGLEVLDGSQYVMEQRGGAGSSSHFTILDHENPKEEQGGTVMPPPTETAEDAINGSVAAKRARNKAKRKKRKAEARKAVAVKEKRKFEEDEGESSEGVEEIQKVQWEWMKCGVELENNICRSLASQGFWQPTPIQEAVLAPAILGRRNIVGAAPTGSGKTLAFLIPIYQLLISKMAEPNLSINQALKPLEALILTPTRELALQIHKEALKLTKYLDQKHRKWIGCLTGGLALAKQKRVLQQQPAVLVATVGRLWELISSREHEHLTDLSQVRFLVIDEADRMVQQGSFPELSKILDTVQCCNPMDDESDDEEDSVPEDPERLLGLPGIPGEARVTMLSDELLARLEGPPGENTSGDSPVVRELDDDEFEEQLEKEGTGDSDDDISLPALPPVNRQTFVYSATLTLPASSDTTKKNKKSRRAVNVDGEIAQILDKARAKGQTKVVDLTKVSGSGKNSPSVNSGTVKNEQKAKLGNSAAFRLPPGLKLQQIKCTQLHKDSHLYAYLMTTVDGSSGPTLVFCNSIAAVRRVGATLQTLGLKVRLLHAQMQQRARFQAVESLKKQNERAIVVASDVAARGLDIPSVATVIHYDAARSIDTFVHRAGRTARGMGEGAVGCSLCLLSPSEDKFHSRIVAALRVDFAEVCLDGRLLGDAQERVNLASKVYSAQDSERKVQRDNQWFQKQAEEAGLELDDDMIGDGLAGGSQRDRVRLQEARLASDRLRSLLKQPMRTQRFGKFLSTNSARSQKVIPPPTILPPKTDQ